MAFRSPAMFPAQEAHAEPFSPLLWSPFTVLFTAVVFTLLSIAVRKDYNDFKALGPGGTPSTVPGYLRIKFLGLFALKNPYMPAPVPAHLKRPAYLTKLGKRPGIRPGVSGIAPHRQTNQKASASIFARLRIAISSLADDPRNGLRQGTSCLEKHGPGLFAVKPINRTRHCSGEVCHAHPSDGSLHLTLHPADAEMVLLRGWGERHPLSSGGWLTRFVPAGFIMVYAPRNEEEIEIVCGIVKAAVWWVAGVDVEANRRASASDGTMAMRKAPATESIECSLPNLMQQHC